MKNKYLFMFLALFIMVISISCTFAADNGTSIGTTGIEQSTNDNSDHSQITLNRISKANVDEPVTITGKVTDKNGTSLKDADVDISLSRMGYGDEEYESIASQVVKTDDNGVYTYSYKSDIGGQLNITVKSDETMKDADASVFIAPKSTKVTMNELGQSNVNERITITGRLTDCDGNALRYTSVGVLINGIGYGDEILWAGDYPVTTNYVKEYTRTNGNGEYTYVYTPEMGGSLDICVYYPGYHYYRFNSTKSHIWVMPKTTIVTVNPVEKNITGGESVNITGSLHDVDGKPLRSTGIGIVNKEYVELNEMKTYIKTDSHGDYCYEYTPDKAGIQDLIIYYPGYHYYRFNQTETTINVIGKDTIISLNEIQDIKTTDALNVTGLLTDTQDKPIYNASVDIFVSREYTTDDMDYHMVVPTDEDGIFTTIEKLPLKVGDVTVTARFIGNAKYYVSNTSTSFHVKSSLPLIIVDPVKNVTFGEDVVISGRLTDDNLNPITDCPPYEVVIALDPAGPSDYGHDFDTVVDEEGKFEISYNYDDTVYTVGEHVAFAQYSGAEEVAGPSLFIITGLDDYWEVPVLNFSSIQYIKNNQIDMNTTLLFTVTWTYNDSTGEANYWLYPRLDDMNKNSYYGDDSTFGSGIPATEEHCVGIYYVGIENTPSSTYNLSVQQEYGSNINRFKAQIQYGNDVYYYECENPVYNEYEELSVATVTISEGKLTSIEHVLPLTKHYLYS